MIIKATRISTKSGGRAVISHVFRGPDNERIDVLIGTEFDVEDAFDDAQAQSYARAIRHVKLAPASVELTDEQAIHAARQIAMEFQGDPESVIVIRHQKKRADLKSEDTHFHILIPEYNHLTGKVMESSWSYARHEKLARDFEQQFGDTQVIGRFGKSVKKALVAEGRHELAETIQVPEQLPESAFTSTKHQILKAKGIDLARMKHIVSENWNPEQSVSDFQKKLEAHGLQAIQGEKSWIVHTMEGTFIGSLDRLTKSKKGQVEAFFNKPEITHIEQDIAKEKNHVRKSKIDSRNNQSECVETTSIIAVGEGNRSEIGTRTDGGFATGVNPLHSKNRAISVESGARAKEDYQALRHWFEERIMRNSHSRYSGMYKSLLKMAKGEKMSLIFNKDGLIMKTVGKRLSRIYNRANFIVEAIRRTKGIERRNKYIREADKIALSIDFSKSVMVDYVLALKDRDLRKSQAILNSISNELEAQRNSKPNIFLAFTKRMAGWKQRLETLERKHTKQAKVVSQMESRFAETKRAVEAEADEIVTTFQALKGTLQQVANMYRKEPVTDNKPPAPEPNHSPENDHTLTL